MKDTFDGTSNMRADLTIKDSPTPASPDTAGSEVGGLDSPRADLTIKTNPGKASGPTSGSAVGGTNQPGATIKSH